MIETSGVESYQTTFKCDMCNVSRTINWSDKSDFSYWWALDEFGVHYSKRQGYMSPYDDDTVEFLICWQCLKRHVRIKVVDHNPLMYEDPETYKDPA